MYVYKGLLGTRISNVENRCNKKKNKNKIRV